MRCWNTNPNSDNAILRSACIKALNLEIVGIAETHLLDNNTISVEGFRWYGQNRTSIHVHARTGSGGVGFLVKESLLEIFNVEILDSQCEGIFWLSLENKVTKDKWNICVCYLPPLNSSRQVDAQKFFDCLLTNIFEFQNNGKMFMQW